MNLQDTNFRRRLAEQLPQQDVTYKIEWKADRRAFEIIRNGAPTGTFGYSRERAVDLAIRQARGEDTRGEVTVTSLKNGRSSADWFRAARCTRSAPHANPGIAPG